MDRRERADDLNLSILTAFQGLQGSIWTALPGYVVSFDPVKMVAKVQPTIMARAQDRFGVFTNVRLPILPDVPVIFPNGGGFTLTFPVKPNDECLVVIASRCIDSWWQSSGVQVQAELRMHDLSDGFALVGPRSQPRVIQAFNPNDVELRSDNHSDYVRLVNGGGVVIHSSSDVAVDAAGDVIVTAGGTVTIQATAVILDAPIVTVTGNLAVEGSQTVGGTLDAVGEITARGIKVSEHDHGGIRRGSERTDPPHNLP